MQAGFVPRLSYTKASSQQTSLQHRQDDWAHMRDVSDIVTLLHVDVLSVYAIQTLLADQEIAIR